MSAVRPTLVTQDSERLLRVVVADDEPLSRRAMRLLLSRHDDVQLVAECADGGAAIAAVRAHDPDVVILDVHMPGLDGFEVVERLERRPAVIFVSARAEQAVYAFAIEAVDYLLKPLDPDRFQEAVERARRAVLAQRQDRWLRILSYRQGARWHVIHTADVEWIEAADYYVRVHTHDGRSHLMREPLNILETRLDPSEFVRVHRSAIVRLASIAQACATTREVVLRDGTRIRTSRGGRARLNEVLNPARRESER